MSHCIYKDIFEQRYLEMIVHYKNKQKKKKSDFAEFSASNEPS